jgi:ribonuclease HII
MAKSATAEKDSLRSPKNKLSNLLAFDRKLMRRQKKEKKGHSLIGVDEVGRGCLAGPVVAGVIFLPTIEEGSELAEALLALDDSKRVVAAERERLAQILESWAWCAIGEASPAEIDEINILQASLLAMKRAFEKLLEVIPADLIESAVLLVDGNKRIPNLEVEQIPVIQGDLKSASIAAASIIAKVYRDKMMAELTKTFPQYGWEKNKGYGSKIHREAIQSFGLTVMHRRSFSFKAVYVESEEGEESFLETFEEIVSTTN